MGGQYRPYALEITSFINDSIPNEEDLSKLKEEKFVESFKTALRNAELHNLSAEAPAPFRPLFNHGSQLDIPLNSRRAFSTKLIKDTVSTPDVILKQKSAEGKPARKLYISYWKDYGDTKQNTYHKVVVSLGERNDLGKVITQNVKPDTGAKSNASFNAYLKEIKNADAIIYVSDELKEVGLSEYPRPTSSASVSQRDTSLHTSGNLNIPEEKGPVKEYFSDNPRSPYRYQEGPENLTQKNPVTRQELYKIIDEGDVALS